MALHSKIAHVRHLGQGDPGWGQTQRWTMPGADPSVSVYDHEEGSEQSNLSRQIRGGVSSSRAQQDPTAPTTTRDARYQFFDSTPAARFFQGYFSVGFSWLAPHYDLVGKLAHQPLSMNWNRMQPGSKEQQPATTFDPYPPGGVIWPKAV